MKILALMGSPREGSNTDFIVDKVLEGAQDAGADIKKFMISELQFAACCGCMKCRLNGECEEYGDDNIAMLVKELNESDGWVLASPVWGGFLPGQFKAVFDRLVGPTMEIKPAKEGVKHVSRLLKKKRNGAIIAVCASPAIEMTEASVIFMKHVLQLHSNGGEIYEIRAPGLAAFGQVKMNREDLKKMYKKMGVPGAVDVAKQSEKQNLNFLTHAYEIGKKLIE